jgi:PKD repeat protein
MKHLNALNKNVKTFGSLLLLLLIVQITKATCNFGYVAMAYQYNCQNRTISYTAYNADSLGTYTYSWAFGDGSTDTLNHKVVTHTYANTGSFTACLTIIKYDNGVRCRDTVICKTMSVTTCPCNVGSAGWSYSYNCNTHTVTFAGTVGDTSGVKLYWGFGDQQYDSLKKSTTHVYANGTYSACLYIKKYTNGVLCKDTAICKTIVVANCNGCTFGTIGWGYTYNCQTHTMSFGASNPDTTSTYRYTWSFGDGAYDTLNHKNATHVYANGTYNVCLSVKKYNGSVVCADTTICRSITVTNCSGCSTYASWGFNLNCKTMSTTLYVGDSTGSYSFLWQLGDSTHTSTLKTPSFTFASNGTYNVCLKITRYVNNTSTKCWDTLICRSVTVNCTSTPPCTIQGYLSNTVTCPGRRAVFALSLADTGATYSYEWTFGDNNAGAGPNNVRNPYHEYSNNGTYYVCVHIRRYAAGTQTVCKDTTICRTVTVNCACNVTANFNFGVNCALKKAEVTNTSTGDSCLTYKWSWGDGTYSTVKAPGYHIYSQAGTYNVCLIVRRCTDTTCVNYICKTVVIPTGCCNTRAYFGATVNCADKKITVLNYSYGDSCMTYKWSWGDGTYSTAANPGYHIYSQRGNYTICLKATKCNDSTCTNTFCKTVEIPQTCCPTVNFYWYNYCGTFRFINTTQGGTSYWWSFGDSSWSAQRNTLHTYGSKRTYNVCLTVFDSVRHCTTTVCKQLTVNCTWWHNAPGAPGAGMQGNNSGSNGSNDAADLSQDNSTTSSTNGLQVNATAGILAYPNPTNSLLNIEIPDSRSTIRITDITGAVLMEVTDISRFYRADVSKLAAGIYFVNVINEKGTQSVRFLKN